jgi:hypothetical protein
MERRGGRDGEKGWKG